MEVGVHHYTLLLGGLTSVFPFETGANYQGETACVSGTVCTVNIHLPGNPIPEQDLIPFLFERLSTKLAPSVMPEYHNCKF